MGTSTSYRAPAVPRWQAFTTALQVGASPERLRSELFNAGIQWEEALASSAVAAFAVGLAEAPSALSARLVDVTHPARLLREYALNMRAVSSDRGFSSAVPLAERAFIAVLTRSAAGGNSLVNVSPSSVVVRLREQLTPVSRAANTYLREVLSQYTRHVMSRELGRLTEGPNPVPLSRSRETTRVMTEQSESVAAALTPSFEDSDAVRDGWSDLVHEAFSIGRRLPPDEK